MPFTPPPEITAPPFDLTLPAAWDALIAVPVPTVLPSLGKPSVPMQVFRTLCDGHPVGWEVRVHGVAPVFGGGEVFDTVDLRGTTRVLLNQELHSSRVQGTYLSVPFFFSPAGWGLSLTTGAPVYADLRSPGVARFLCLDATLDAVAYGGTPTDILREHTARTGRMAGWPEWAHGPWMSRASYLSEAEIHGVLDDQGGAQCPVAVVHVDAWLAGNVFREFTCSWEIDRGRFPAGWTDRLRARGVRVSLWLNPFVLRGSALAAHLAERDLLLRGPSGELAVTPDLDHRHLIDFTNPEAVGWWGDQVRNLLVTERPDALKLDFAEEVPLDARCHDGRPGWTIRNSYARDYQRATASAIPEDLRPFPFFCRSGTTGAQATPCHWVGDTRSSWEGLSEALRACLSLSLSGFALVSHDAGGFHTPGAGVIPRTLLDGGEARFTADVEPELFGRWGQWAALSPVTRFHGLGFREPTAYPEPWRSAVIEALRLRERLRPHLVRAAAAAGETGLPVMRPLALIHPDATLPAEAWHCYYLGADLLVAPVLEPGGRATVWLPSDGWRPLLGAPELGAGLHHVTLGAHQFPIYARPTP